MTTTRELQELITLRNEKPALVGAQSATADAAELYRFADGEEVIVTNAGLVTERDEGFHDLRTEIVK